MKHVARSVPSSSVKQVLWIVIIHLLFAAPAFSQADLVTGHHQLSDVVPASKMGAASSQHAALFDVSYYHLTLNLNGLRNPVLVGRNRILGKALANTDTLQFDLSDNMVVDFVSLASGGVLNSSHENDRITIALGATLEAGAGLELDIVYHGTPESTGFGAFTTIQDIPGKPNTIWTLSEPYGSKEWWPSDDNLADKADSVRITVRVPAPMTVGSNGVLVNRVHNLDGSTTFDWLHRYPIATYLVSLAIGNYDEYVQTYSRPGSLAAQFGSAQFPIQHFAYQGSDAFQGISPTSGWHLALDMMPVFEDWMGPYPFENEKYGHAHVTFRGGMEHQTLSSMGNIGAELIAHELAHQWFGDKLTPSSWKDLWLNEGFATMGEFFIYESDPKYAYLGDLFGSIYNDRARLSKRTLVLGDTSNVSAMFDFSTVYAKGYMVLRMIRGIVGDDVFKQILRTYTAQSDLAYGSVTTEDFRQIVEQVSGRSFETFFDQWVYTGTGYPSYRAKVENLMSESGLQARITVSQVQEVDQSTVAVFDMPIWLQLNTAGKSLLLQVENNEKTQAYVLDVDAPILSVQVDPEGWILRGENQSDVGTSEENLLPSAFSMSVYPNPSTGIFNLHLESDAPSLPVEASVFDVLGRLVIHGIERTIGRGITDIGLDGSDLPAGVYVVRVQNGSSVQNQTVVLTR